MEAALACMRPNSPPHTGCGDARRRPARGLHRGPVRDRRRVRRGSGAAAGAAAARRRSRAIRASRNRHLGIAVPRAIGLALIGLGEAGSSWDSLGYVNLPATTAIGAASMLSAPWGVVAAHRLEAALLKRVFGLYMVAIGLTMMRKALDIKEGRDPALCAGRRRSGADRGDWQSLRARRGTRQAGSRPSWLGRSRDVWPNVGRVTVGSASEMAAFAAAVEQVV